MPATLQRSLVFTTSACSGVARALVTASSPVSPTNTSTKSATSRPAALRSFCTRPTTSRASHEFTTLPSSSSLQSTATTIEPSSLSMCEYCSVLPAKLRLTTRSSPFSSKSPSKVRLCVFLNAIIWALVSSSTAFFISPMRLPSRLPRAPKLGVAEYSHHWSSASVTVSEKRLSSEQTYDSSLRSPLICTGSAQITTMSLTGFLSETLRASRALRPSSTTICRASISLISVSFSTDAS
mmetsp:Transcript_25434/g.68265  ORF Transcript_25434/g.68265 Transcript_25434/m.68265 type:complete len:238 (-) Transcript_25434:2549-3262(-)